MREAHLIREQLHVALNRTDDVCIRQGDDVDRHCEPIRADILASACEPFWVMATVMPPAFPHFSSGQSISGWCVAHKAGYWLVLNPEDSNFYCFWGHTPEQLGAHGICGSPLYCWSA